jgi:hypothetical protein
VREQAGIDSRERAEQCRVRGVDREPELRNALAPVEQVAPVAADGGEVETSGSHSEDRWHVLDQRIHAPLNARVRVEAEELLDGVRVDRARGAELVRREWNEEMNGQHWRADTRSKLGAPLDAGARLLVEAVDANEGAARPGDRRLGRNGQLM